MVELDIDQGSRFLRGPVKLVHISRDIIEIVVQFGLMGRERNGIVVRINVVTDVSFLVIDLYLINKESGTLIGEQFPVREIEIGHDRELGKELAEKDVDPDRNDRTFPVDPFVRDYLVDKILGPVVVDLHNDPLVVTRIEFRHDVCNLHERLDGLGIAFKIFGKIAVLFIVKDDHRLGFRKRYVVELVRGEDVALSYDDGQVVLELLPVVFDRRQIMLELCIFASDRK